MKDCSTYKRDNRRSD